MLIRKRPQIRKTLILVLLLLVVMLIAFLSLSALFRPGLLLYAETRVQAIATDAIYGAMLELMSEESEPYVHILEEDGQVYYIEMNNRALNRLAARCSTLVQDYINQIGTQGIEIPLGTASGIPMLAGMGPNIHMTFRPEGTSQLDFSSEFRSAGINQTMHRVHMVVHTDIAMVLPGASKNITTKVDMTVAEHVIVGKVPDAYAGGSAGGILNLTPSS